ncbi:MAG: hypothetical protein KAS23_12185 [Anaerohalosphaera sp.]|nr:hypothetical protein [Anaerohalosphaera sp.]
MSTRKSKSQLIASWVFGSLTFAFLMGAFWFGPDELPPQKHKILAFFTAILAGLFVYFFSCKVKLIADMNIPYMCKIGIQASGGAGMFVLVFLFWFSELAPIDVEDELESIGRKQALMSDEISQIKDAMNKGFQELNCAVATLRGDLASDIFAFLVKVQNRPMTNELLEQVTEAIRTKLRSSGSQNPVEEIREVIRLLHEAKVIDEKMTNDERIVHFYSAISFLMGDYVEAKEILGEMLKKSPNHRFSMAMMEMIEKKMNRNPSASEAVTDYSQRFADATEELNETKEQLETTEKEVKKLKSMLEELGYEFSTLSGRYEDLYRQYQERLNSSSTPVVAEAPIGAGSPEQIETDGNLRATNYSISTFGSDSAYGTIQEPLQTVSRAVNIAQSGDILRIRPGDYRFSFTNWKSSDDPNDIKKTDIEVYFSPLHRNFEQLVKLVTNNRTLVLSPGHYRLPIAGDNPNEPEYIWFRIPQSWDSFNLAAENSNSEEFWVIGPGNYKWDYKNNLDDDPKELTLEIEKNI